MAITSRAEIIAQAQANVEDNDHRGITPTEIRSILTDLSETAHAGMALVPPTSVSIQAIVAEIRIPDNSSRFITPEDVRAILARYLDDFHAAAIARGVQNTGATYTPLRTQLSADLGGAVGRRSITAQKVRELIIDLVNVIFDWVDEVDDTPPPVNNPPVLTIANTTVNSTAGTAAANNGTWSDPDGDLVTMSSSLGTVTKNISGTWTWAYTPVIGDDGTTVTITASDGDLDTVVTFTLNVQNAAETVTFSDWGVNVPMLGVAVENLASHVTFNGPDPVYSIVSHTGAGEATLHQNESTELWYIRYKMRAETSPIDITIQADVGAASDTAVLTVTPFRTFTLATLKTELEPKLDLLDANADGTDPELVFYDGAWTALAYRNLFSATEDVYYWNRFKTYFDKIRNHANAVTFNVDGGTSGNPTFQVPNRLGSTPKEYGGMFTSYTDIAIQNANGRYPTAQELRIWAAPVIHFLYDVVNGTGTLNQTERDWAIEAYDWVHQNIVDRLIAMHGERGAFIDKAFQSAATQTFVSAASFETGFWDEPLAAALAVHMADEGMRRLLGRDKPEWMQPAAGDRTQVMDPIRYFHQWRDSLSYDADGSCRFDVGNVNVSANGSGPGDDGEHEAPTVFLAGQYLYSAQLAMDMDLDGYSAVSILTGFSKTMSPLPPESDHGDNVIKVYQTPDGNFAGITEINMTQCANYIDGDTGPFRASVDGWTNNANSQAGMAGHLYTGMMSAAPYSDLYEMSYDVGRILNNVRFYQTPPDKDSDIFHSGTWTRHGVSNELGYTAFHAAILDADKRYFEKGGVPRKTNNVFERAAGYPTPRESNWSIVGGSPTWVSDASNGGTTWCDLNPLGKTGGIQLGGSSAKHIYELTADTAEGTVGFWKAKFQAFIPATYTRSTVVETYGSYDKLEVNQTGVCHIRVLKNAGVVDTWSYTGPYTPANYHEDGTFGTDEIHIITDGPMYDAMKMNMESIEVELAHGDVMQVEMWCQFNGGDPSTDAEATFVTDANFVHNTLTEKDPVAAGDAVIAGTSGNDGTAALGNPALPYQTHAAAIAAVSDGSGYGSENTIWLKRGETSTGTEAYITINRSHLRFRGYGRGPDFMIDGADTYPSTSFPSLYGRLTVGLFELRDCVNVKCRDFQLKDTLFSGVGMRYQEKVGQQYPDDCEISHFRCYESQTEGVILEGSDVAASNSSQPLNNFYVHDFIVANCQRALPKFDVFNVTGQAVTTANATNYQVRRFRCMSYHKEGVDRIGPNQNGVVSDFVSGPRHRDSIYGGARGTALYADASGEGLSDIRAERFIAYGDATGVVVASEGGGDMDNLIFKNFIVFGNKQSAMAFSDEPGIPSYVISNVFFENGVFYAEVDGANNLYCMLENNTRGTVTGINIRACILSANRSEPIRYTASGSPTQLSTAAALRDCLLHNRAGSVSIPLGANGKEGDPLFEQRLINGFFGLTDFAPGTTSPAINGVATTWNGRDLGGNRRPDTSSDIGAIQS